MVRRFIHLALGPSTALASGGREFVLDATKTMAGCFAIGETYTARVSQVLESGQCSLSRIS